MTLELEPRHADVARANLEERRAVRRGRPARRPGAEVAGGDCRRDAGPFDLVFIDADKPNNRNYLTWAMRLSRPGTVIICDNVIRDGAVLDGSGRDPNVVGARAAFDFIGREGRLDGTAIQTVGAKGYDGFAIAIVN